MSSADAVRVGRPPKVDDAGVATRERLLDAAIAACVEHGFDGATVGDIAQRADVSAPAIYNHFGGKFELMVAAGHAALARIRPPDSPTWPSAAVVVRTFLSDGFAQTRTFLVELHLAGQRHPQVASMLDSWHDVNARHWRGVVHDDPDAVVKLFFAVLLGLCHIDALGAMPGSTAALTIQAERLVTALFPEEETS